MKPLKPFNKAAFKVGSCFQYFAFDGITLKYITKITKVNRDSIRGVLLKAYSSGWRVGEEDFWRYIELERNYSEGRIKVTSSNGFIKALMIWQNLNSK